MILVVGTGRSGTSAVAKILHENGINMGNAFVSSRDHENGSSYEDTECKRINTDFLLNKMTYDEYIRRLFKYGKSKTEPWGVKHPAIVYVLGIYLQVFDPVIIRCSREREGVVASCMRCYGFSHQKAEHLYDYRTVVLDSLLRRIEHLDIDFTERLSEDDILEQMAGFLHGQNPAYNLGELARA